MYLLVFFREVLCLRMAVVGAGAGVGRGGLSSYCRAVTRTLLSRFSAMYSPPWTFAHIECYSYLFFLDS